MFVCSLKASRLKLILALILLFVAVILCVTLAVGRGGGEVRASAAAERSVRFDGIKTEEDLIGFARKLGMEIKVPAYGKADIDIPRVFDAVYKKYNDVQRRQGLDLSRYRGKTLARYTYELTNYPGIPADSDQTAFLTLFVYKNKVVAGDISSKAMGGFVRTFTDFSSPDMAQSSANL